MLAALALAVPGLAAPAQAHTTLKSSSPAKDATVSSPSEIVLTYNDNVILPQVRVTGEDGRTHQAGNPTAVDSKVTQPIGATLPPGRYTVAWRVVASDGHPISGTYRFRVEGAPETGASSPGASQAPAQPSVEPSVQASPAAAPSGDEGGSGWLWIGLGAVLVGLLAGGGALLRRRRAGGTPG